MEKTQISLEGLLLPGTPDSVRKRYESLAQRAETTSFDLLEEDLVVLDTETTGLSFRKCELIQISAARLSGRSAQERYETYVRPNSLIPPEIQKLTGIHEYDVADAPSGEQAVADLADFVGGEPILAHNATFDRTFIEKTPGGSEVSDIWIDTLALSRIALPRLRSHRLADMAQAFGCAPVTHNASADVDALIGMWRIILLGLADLPQGLLDKLATLHPEVEWPFRAILGHIAQQQAPRSFSLKAIRKDLVHEHAREPHVDAADPERAPLTSPKASEIQEAFSAQGLVGTLFEKYEARPEQLSMALEVRDALADSQHRAIEAGTGTGKSLAYLVPAILFAQRNDLSVGIATKTNALTDQLVSHELPALDEALPNGVSYISLKGYDHYPCLHRLDRACEDDLPLRLVDGHGRSENGIASDMLTALAVSYAFACQSPDGDLDTLGIRWRFVPRSMLTTTPAECLHGKCPYYPEECFIHGARRRAASADIVVTNHSLLLRNVTAEGRILPPIRHWIIDEAHGFESEARRQWAREVSAEQAHRGFERLGSTKTGTLHSLMVDAAGLEHEEGDATHASGDVLVSRLLVKFAAAVSRASLSCADLFDHLRNLAQIGGSQGGYDLITAWIDEQLRSTPEWQQFAESGTAALERLDEAVKDMRQVMEALEGATPMRLATSISSSLSEDGVFLSELASNLRLVLEGTDDSYVYSAEVSRRKKDVGKECLRAEKLDIGRDLAKRWLPEMESVIFTSATMTVSGSFEHFDHSVGFDLLEAGEHRDIQLPSSFDYERNMGVIVAQDMPQATDPTYIDKLCDLLFDVHQAMDGSVLTLFTNRREMEEVYKQLQPRLSSLGLELLCQERGSSPWRLREQFLADKRRSLLALRSFWEGFDAAGDTLRCVVITKLPFASPRDPLVRERDRREQRAWWRYSLPEAVLNVKQAAGRLIRSSTDIGVLVIADSRVATKRYGRTFTSSLPNPHPQQMECSHIGAYLRMWRQSREKRS